MMMMMRMLIFGPNLNVEFVDENFHGNHLQSNVEKFKIKNQQIVFIQFLLQVVWLVLIQLPSLIMLYFRNVVEQNNPLLLFDSVDED